MPSHQQRAPECHVQAGDPQLVTGGMETRCDREYWRGLSGEIISMPSISALSHEQLVSVVQELRDALYFSSSNTAEGTEITVPLTDELAVTGSDAADVVVEIFERHELTPRVEEPAPETQCLDAKSIKEIAQEAAFIAGSEAFHASKNATPCQDPAVTALMKQYCDQPWGIGKIILDGWISGWHQTNAKYGGPSVGVDSPDIAVSGFQAFDKSYVDPPQNGRNGFDGRSQWIMLEQLQSALTDAGRIWFSARTDEEPVHNGHLPSVRRLWCHGDKSIKLLHQTDEHVAIACGDDGQLAEIWASPSVEAFAASHGISIERAEERLGTAWESILDISQRNCVCTMVEGFTIADGRRDPNMGLG